MSEPTFDLKEETTAYVQYLKERFGESDNISWGTPASILSAIAEAYKQFKDGDVIDQTSLDTNLSLAVNVLISLFNDLYFGKDIVEDLNFNDLFPNGSDTPLSARELKTYFLPGTTPESLKGELSDERYSELPDQFVLQTFNDTYLCGKGIGVIGFFPTGNNTNTLEEHDLYCSLRNIDHTKDSKIGLILRVYFGGHAIYPCYLLEWDEETSSYTGTCKTTDSAGHATIFSSTATYSYNTGANKGYISLEFENFFSGKVFHTEREVIPRITRYIEDYPDNGDVDTNYYISWAVAFPVTSVAFTPTVPLTDETKRNPLALRNISVPRFESGLEHHRKRPE